jgi:hypothetical protein
MLAAGTCPAAAGLAYAAILHRDGHRGDLKSGEAAVCSAGPLSDLSELSQAGMLASVPRPARRRSRPSRCLVQMAKKVEVVFKIGFARRRS